MRATGSDIVELFGYAPDDTTEAARNAFRNAQCPFTSRTCTKTNHDQTIIYGTCSVTARKSEESIICPKRLYADKYGVLANAAALIWGDIPLVVGGTVEKIRAQASKFDDVAVAFGQGSAREVEVQSNGKLSMDWVIQRYKNEHGTLQPQDYIGIEIQSIDTTGNYRENWTAYKAIKNGKTPRLIPNSAHGLNWANVHKRLIPQIIRKGNIYARTSRCVGFFFILPDVVYQKFEEVLGKIADQVAPAKSNLSILTYKLGDEVAPGEIRELTKVRVRHHSIEDIVNAFTSDGEDLAPSELDNFLTKIFRN